MIGIIIDLFIVAVVGVVAFLFIRAWKAGAGLPVKDRLLESAKDSATVLWSYAVIIGTGIVTALAAVGDLIDPGLVEQIKAALPPNLVPALVIGFFLITIAARLRSLR